MEKFECSVALDGELPACDKRIAVLHDYWRSIRPAGSLLPGRQHFDPAAVPRHLPTVRLYDVERAPLRFRYRVFGTELVRQVGRDLTGTFYEDSKPDACQSQSYRDLIFVAEGNGICYRRGFPFHFEPDRDHVTHERILLPLGRNGKDVDMVLGFTVIHPVHTAAALRALG